MSKNKEVTSNRERYTERLKSKYPDKEYVDDEEIFAQINDDYDTYDNELSGYKEREKSFSDLFSNNPRSAAFLTDWRKGEDPIIGMIRKYGDDFKAALEDPEKLEALAVANQEYADRVAQDRDYEDTYQKNVDETIGVIEQLQESDGLSDDDINEAMEFLINVYRDGILGKFSKESILMAHKSIKHDVNVEQADQEGELRGRNMKIEEKLRKPKKGDGTANLAGKNGAGDAAQNKMPDMGAIGRNYGSKDIFERGNFRRTRR